MTDLAYLAFEKNGLSFAIIVAGYIIFSAGLIIIFSSIAGLLKACAEKNSKGKYKTLIACVIAIVISWVSITQTGEIKRTAARSARMSDLCATAKLDIHKTVTDVRSVFIEPDYNPVLQNGGASFGGMGAGMLNSGYIESYEVINRVGSLKNGMKYLRITRESNSIPSEESNEIQSEFAVISTDSTTEHDKKMNISGAEMIVINRKTNENLAKLRYFFNNENYREFCPSMNGILFPSYVPMYVLDLGTESTKAGIKKRLFR